MSYRPIREKFERKQVRRFSLAFLKPGAPKAERGPGASSNKTDFRFRELQNRRRQCRNFVQIMM